MTENPRNKATGPKQKQTKSTCYGRSSLIPTVMIDSLKKRTVEIVSKIVKRYRFSKYKRSLDGLLFAIIAGVALWLCVYGMSEYQASRAKLILPFLVAVASTVLGFITMLRHPEAARGKA